MKNVKISSRISITKLSKTGKLLRYRVESIIPKMSIKIIQKM